MRPHSGPHTGIRIIHNLPLDQLRFHIAIAKVSANPVINRPDRERDRRPT